MFRRGLWLSVMLCGLTLAAVAQASNADEQAFFGSDGATATPAPSSVPAAGSTEEDFFNSGSAEVSGQTAATDYKETFTKQQPIQFGGNFKLVMKAGIDYYRDVTAWTPDYFWRYDNIEIPSAGFPTHTSQKVENSNLDLEGSLYFSARPTNSLRLYGKTKITYPFSDLLSGYMASDATGSSFQAVSAYLPNIQIWELFADFNIADKVFFRAGKQMVKWGANPYAFWSPADVISLGSIDVNNRGADLEGPFAIKANIPFGDNNLDFYMTAPSNSAITSITDMGYAARVKFLVGGWELGTGVVNSKAQDIKFVATASGSIWKFNVWGEGLVNRTASNLIINDNGGFYSIGGPRSDWFFSGTAGISYTNADIYLDTVMLQYYYNGMGTNNMTSAANNVRGFINQVPALKDAATAAIYAASAGAWTGMHYLALTAQESFVHEGKIHLVATWIADLSDWSGTVMPSVNFDITDEIILGLNFTVNYGPSDSQFIGIAGENALQRPRFNMGLSLNLGTGNF